MATLVSSDLEQAKKYFAATRSRIEAATSGLTEAQFAFRPTPANGEEGCWSIAEILDHLATVHERVVGRVRSSLASAPAPEPGRDSQLIDSIVMDKISDRGAGRFSAPEFIRPAGQRTPQESLARIFQGLDELEQFVESTPDLRGHVLESPPLKAVTGGVHTTLDGYQTALIAAAHDQRHIRQIEEWKARPGYPSA
jgi:hypothetical protein